jgi:hypothetical protein
VTGPQDPAGCRDDEGRVQLVADEPTAQISHTVAVVIAVKLRCDLQWARRGRAPGQQRDDRQLETMPIGGAERRLRQIVQRSRDDAEHLTEGLVSG